MQETAYYRCGVRGYRTFSKYTIEIEDVFRSFTVKFKPGGFYGIFGIPLLELTNRDLPLEDMGILPAKEILDRLSVLDDVDEMKAILEEYLLPIMVNRKIREFYGDLPDYRAVTATIAVARSAVSETMVIGGVLRSTTKALRGTYGCVMAVAI